MHYASVQFLRYVFVATVMFLCVKEKREKKNDDVNWIRAQCTNRIAHNIQSIHFSMLDELRARCSRSKLFCFFSICIFRTRSANVSVRNMVKSSGSLAEFGGNGGRRNVYDSSTCGILSNVVVCLRRGSGILISTSAPFLSAAIWLSSNSGVDVHDDGRFGRTATHSDTHTHTTKGEEIYFESISALTTLIPITLTWLFVILNGRQIWCRCPTSTIGFLRLCTANEV